eukprot:3913372-Rhodomonas_salina.2
MCALVAQCTKPTTKSQLSASVNLRCQLDSDFGPVLGHSHWQCATLAVRLDQTHASTVRGTSTVMGGTWKDSWTSSRGCKRAPLQNTKKYDILWPENHGTNSYAGSRLLLLLGHCRACTYPGTKTLQRFSSPPTRPHHHLSEPATGSSFVFREVSVSGGRIGLLAYSWVHCVCEYDSRGASVAVLGFHKDKGLLLYHWPAAVSVEAGRPPGG